MKKFMTGQIPSPGWWSRTPIAERRTILDAADLWDGNTYAERTWEELPVHIRRDLDNAYLQREAVR